MDGGIQGAKPVAGLTRKELKQDEFTSTYEAFQEYAREHYRELALALAGVLLVVGAVGGWQIYDRNQESSANTLLGNALDTFHAYVGSAAPDALAPGQASFPTATAKYRKAIEQFSEVVAKYPRQRAAEIARYHLGICQSELGDNAAAIKTLQAASGASDGQLRALARFALAGVLVKSGRLSVAMKIYQDLEAHPTSTVPKATAMLAMADAYAPTQPAQARQIYQRMQKEFAGDAYLADILKQQMSGLAP
jgi:predicted negative regulator of RcsB-dependent stress response